MTPGRRFPLALAVAAGLASFAGPGRAEPPAREPVRAVVELFTSQGCSSCPPADAVLAGLADRDGVLALSYHVDYWNYLGWTDPFASERNTARQRDYAKRFEMRYVYTPQMVVGGRTQVTGSHRAEVETALRAQPAPLPVAVALRAEAGGGLTATIGGAPAPATASVWLVGFARERTTRVEAGENAGRLMRNRNVVRSFERIGTWRGDALELAVAASIPADADGCAVLVQEDGHGRILGAAAMALAR